jgi:hypothetical protein
MQVRNVGLGRVAFAAAALVVAAAPAFPQASFEATVGGSLEALRGATVGATGRSSVSGGASLGLEFDEECGSLSYDVEGGTYATPGDWSYLLHRPRARYQIDLGTGKHLYLGATGTVRRNGDAWASADYAGVGGFANLELKPAPGTTLRAGYRLDRRWFPEISDLDQAEHDVFASLLVNLPSRTTLIAESHLGFESYAGEPTVAPGPGAEAAPIAGAGRGVADTGAGGGVGEGGRGPGMGPSLRSAPPVPPSSEGDHARQVTLLARVARSLGGRTGLSAQATWRTTSGQVPPAVVTTPAGFFDDGVYDDPFASDLLGLQLRLKHAFAGGAVVEATGHRFRQSYVATPALGPDGAPLAGEPLREDRVWRAAGRVSLPLFPSRTGLLGVTLEVAYAYTRSRSNDVFYDYADHAAGLALQVAR